MTCGSIPDCDHITHYVRPSKVLDDDSVDGSAFRGGALDDDGLSVNWLEYFIDGSETERLYAVACKIQQETRRNGRFAEMNIREVMDRLAIRSYTGSVIHDPQGAKNGHGPDPSHSLIRGLPNNDPEEIEIVADAIADCVRILHPPPKLKARSQGQ